MNRHLRNFSLVFLIIVVFVAHEPSAIPAMLDSPRVSGPGVLSNHEDHVPSEILVKFKAGTALSDRMQAHARAGVDTLSEIRALGVQRVRSRRGETTEALLQRYRSDPRVEYAEANVIFHARVIPNDSSFSDLWGLHNTGQSGGTVDADIDAPEAWDGQIGSSGVVVANIDSGVDYNHPDLVANMWTNPGEIAGNGIDDDNNGYVDDYRGWDFANNDNNPFDDYGHGTHVAGTTAAVGNNGVGVTGVSWQSKIMSLKYLNGAGSGTSLDAAEAIVYAADMGAKVANASWGCHGSGCFSQVIEDAISYANTAGMLFVAAAGNDGTNNDVTIDYPCVSTQPNVLCIASTTRTDQRSSFSNYGATTVDLGAPGSAILSTVPVGACPYCDPSGYIFASGTSMAAPHVSGAAALIASQFPTYTVAQVRDAIVSSVDPLASLSGITVTGGRLNIQKALLSSFTVTAVPASQTVNAGGSTTYTVTVTSEDTFSGPVALTLSSVNSNLSGSFSPATVTVPAGGSATSTLTVTAQTAITAGSYTVVIRGSASIETHTTTVTVVIPAPDLVMTEVTPLVTTVEQGQAINVSNMVQNQGGSNAGSFVIAFHLSVDAVYGGADDVALTPTRSVGSLAVGASAGATTVVVVPSTTPVATYFVCAAADSGGTVAELSEGNNAFCGTTPIDVTAATTPPARLGNISTRGFVQTGDNVMIGGFVIQGSVAKTILVRARGPSLAAFGVAGAMANPYIELYSGQTKIAQNNDWQTTDPLCGAPAVACGDATDIQNTGRDPCSVTSLSCTLDSAIHVTLAPGPYTAILRGVGGGTGVGIVEAIDLDGTTAPKLVNISTRGRVLTGDSVMIGGMVIGSGSTPKTVLIRVRGPSLVAFGVSGVMANPYVELYSGSTLIARNDNWQTTDPLCGSPAVACGTATDIQNTGRDPCSVTTTSCTLDAAIYITLPPGPYTAIVRGVGGGTGVGIVEVIDLSP